MPIRRMNYAHGMFISNARKVATFVFGDFFYRCVEDPDHARFVFYIHKSVNGEWSEKVSMDGIKAIGEMVKQGIPYEEIYNILNNITCEADKEKIVVLNVKEEIDVNYWKSFWGGGFHLEYINVETEED